MKLWPLRNWNEIKGSLASLSVERKIILYAVLTLIIYGATIVVDNVVLVDLIDEAHYHPDLDTYRNRTQAILDGHLLYRDIPNMEAPPLINYILVPAQVLGGADQDWVWSAYFSFFAFLIAVVMYLALRPHDDLKAFLAGVIVLISPFTIVESGTGEDESIAAFLFILAAIYMLNKRRNAASIAITVGIWTKMFSVLLLPVHFLQQRNWKDRLMTLAVPILLSLLVVLPFMVLAWDDFINFPTYYLLGKEGASSGGSSLWHFLAQGGWSIPSTIELAILGVAMAVAYLYPWYKRLPAWQSATIMLIVFFTFYPKVHGGYWIMLVALLSVWAVQDRRILYRIFLGFIPLMVATAFAQGEGEGSAAPVEFYGSWFLGFCLAVLGLLIFADAVRLALKERPFIDEETLEATTDAK